MTPSNTDRMGSVFPNCTSSRRLFGFSLFLAFCLSLAFSPRATSQQATFSGGYQRFVDWISRSRSKSTASGHYIFKAWQWRTFRTTE